MKRSRTIIHSFALLLLFSLLVLVRPQNMEMKHFAKDGLAFDYPAVWKLEDQSQPSQQHLVLRRGGSGAQLMILARYETITTLEQLAAARHDITEPFVEALVEQFQKMGTRAERSTITTEVGGARAEGVRLRAVLGGVPGNADTYSLLLGRRLVMLSLIGEDAELKEAAADWDTIRRSVKVEDATPATKTDK
jgi:hypothetical protein